MEVDSRQEMHAVISLGSGSRKHCRAFREVSQGRKSMMRIRSHRALTDPVFSCHGLSLLPRVIMTIGRSPASRWLEEQRMG